MGGSQGWSGSGDNDVGWFVFFQRLYYVVYKTNNYYKLYVVYFFLGGGFLRFSSLKKTTSYVGWLPPKAT